MGQPSVVVQPRKGSVEIWGVDWRDTQENGRRWLAQYGNPYSRVVFDAESSLAIDLGVTGAPESFLVDKKGQIRYKHVGIIDDKVWADILQPLVRVLEAET